MKVNEILMEVGEPVPKLSQLWKWSDEFSDEVNERARKAAMAEIESIKQSNKDGATKRKEASKEFEAKDFTSFGINPKAFLKDYISDMLKTIKKHPHDAKDYFVDMDTVTKENMYDELVKKAKADKEADPEGFVATEIFFNAGPAVEKKYGTKLEALIDYRNSIHRLNPVVKKKAVAALNAQLKSALK